MKRTRGSCVAEYAMHSDPMGKRMRIREVLEGKENAGGIELDKSKPVEFGGTIWYSQEQVDKMLREQWEEQMRIFREQLGQVHHNQQEYFMSMLS